MAILDRLTSISHLTSSEKQVVQYILDHKDEIISFNISDLADATNTSNATIIRLCHKLDLSGYKEFKIEFVKDLERRRKEKMEIDMSYPFTGQKSSQEVMKTILDLSKESLDSCYETVSSRDLEQAAKYIAEANITYVFGIGDSMISSMGFANRMIKLGKHCVSANQYGELAAYTYLSSKQDAALFISYTGKTLIDQKYLKMMKRSGCKLILISANTDLKGFDVAIHFPKREAIEGKMATFYSQICIHYILNALYAMVFNLDFQKNYRQKQIVDYHL